MAQYSKVIKLGTLLYNLNPHDFVLITFNHGRNTWSGRVCDAEQEFKKDLGSEIIGLTVNSGTIQAFV